MSTNEPTGDPEEQPTTPEGTAEVAPPPPRSTRSVFLIAAASAAGVAVFALIFFMAGFAAHAMLDDDDNGGSGTTVSRVSASVADDPSWGPEDATVVIEAFSDFECPYCKKFAEDTLPQLREQYGDKVRFVARDLPLASIHPVATSAAEAAGCAHEQGVYWEYHDLLYANQDTLAEDSLIEYAVDAGADEEAFTECLTSGQKMPEVLLDVQDAQRQGVSSTPSFVINGLVIAGAQPYSVFESLIDQQLAAN